MDLGFDLKEWEAVTPIEAGDYETLELGGHEIVIVDARLYKSEVSGNTSLRICVDIAGNDKQKGFFKKQYDENTAQDKKWPTGAVRYLSLKSENLAYTKGFITSLEKSNTGFKFDTKKGWEQLKKLKCAGVFGLEEYENDKGETKLATRLVQFRSLDKLSEIKVPSVKKLNGDFVSYEEYMATRNNATNEIEKDFGDVITIDDNFLD